MTTETLGLVLAGGLARRMGGGDKPLTRIGASNFARGAQSFGGVAQIVRRYGDFVLLRPPVKPATWLLWFGPLGRNGGAWPQRPW